MSSWFQQTIIEPGRFELFCFFAAMIISFACIRVSVRMIRAKVRWWPGNVKSGDLHIHHAVFGVILMVVGGMAGLAMSDSSDGVRGIAAAIFGAGTALVLDEFALILHLRDVYWSGKGRLSVDAVFVAIAVTGLLLLGFRPIVIGDVMDYHSDRGVLPNALTLAVVSIGVNLILAIITLLKGKIWTGLLGLFVPVLLVVGAIRLARPHSPWARWFYVPNKRQGEGKLAQSFEREERLHRPASRVRIWFQELIAGRHD